MNLLIGSKKLITLEIKTLVL